MYSQGDMILIRGNDYLYKSKNLLHVHKYQRQAS